MTANFESWVRDGVVYGWHLPPPSPWPLRLPIIRHLRVIRLVVRIERHNATWASLGYVPTGYDQWVVYGMWKGLC